MIEWQEDLLSAVDKAALQAGEIFEPIKEAGRKLGFDYVCYGIRVAMPMAPPQVLILENYRKGWIQRYESKRYVEVDPTVAHAISSQAPLVWEDVEDTAPEFWEDARGHDLRHGWAQSTLDGTGTTGLLTVARGSEQLRRTELDQKEQQLRWLAGLAHLALLHRLRGDLRVHQGKQLSAREIEVLKWAAAGKTVDETGDILSVSCDTVKFHLKNASRKLNCVNKTQAAVHAAMLGLLV